MKFPVSTNMRISLRRNFSLGSSEFVAVVGRRRDQSSLFAPDVVGNFFHMWLGKEKSQVGNVSHRKFL